MGTKVINGDNENNLSCTIVNVQMNDGLWFINDNYKSSYVEFITDKEIVDFVVKLVKKLTKSNRYGLIYLTENESQSTYAEALNKAGISAKVINSSTKSALRESIKQELEQEKLKVIISGTITQKGVSIKRLDYIINLSSLTKEAYEQLVGRLRRKHPTKNDPIFFDLHFEGILLKQAWSRSSIAEVVAKRSNDTIKTIGYNKFIKKLI
jgi:superfamily II DNA or RNA helicase